MPGQEPLHQHIGLGDAGGRCHLPQLLPVFGGARGAVAHEVHQPASGRGQVARRAVRGQVQRLVDAQHEPWTRAAQPEIQAGRRHGRTHVSPPWLDRQEAASGAGPARRDHHRGGADHLRLGVHLPPSRSAAEVLRRGMEPDLCAGGGGAPQQARSQLLPATVEVFDPAFEAGPHLADCHRGGKAVKVAHVGADPDERGQDHRRVRTEPERVDPLLGASARQFTPVRADYAGECPGDLCLGAQPERAAGQPAVRAGADPG
jgi:hypothetical protein